MYVCMYSIKCYTGCGPNLLPRSTKCYTGCGPNLGAKIHDIEAQLKEITEAQSEWAKRCEVSRSSNGSLPFVTNGRTKLLKVHQVSVDRMGHPPYQLHQVLHSRVLRQEYLVRYVLP